MSDYRIVQCFGTKRRRGKPDKPCRRKYQWTSIGGKDSHFGPRGAQACPHCGTIPFFAHPYNRYLNGEMTFEEASASMPEFEKGLEEKT